MVRNRDAARAVRAQTPPRDAGGATPRGGLGRREGCREAEGARAWPYAVSVTDRRGRPATLRTRRVLVGVRIPKCAV